MKKFIGVCILSMLCASLFSVDFDPGKYEKVDIEKVKATPEEYKNKKVSLDTVYFKYETTFLPYMDKSGFKAGKNYYLQVKPGNFPVMVDKNDETNSLIPSLKAGSKVRIYGKVKKFSYKPEATIWPHYFLEMDKLEIIEAGSGKLETENEEGIPKTVPVLPSSGNGEGFRRGPFSPFRRPNRQ
ncbi:MAG TPA: hypothetical protein PK821_04395 [Victivallales bacterium]|nr:hypothetical protein [Victivallales bacterium]